MKPGPYWQSRLKMNAAQFIDNPNFRRNGDTKHFDLNYGAWRSDRWHARIEAAWGTLIQSCYGDCWRDNLLGNPAHRNSATMTSLHFGYVATLLRSQGCYNRVVEVGGGFGGFAAALERVGTEHVTLTDFAPMLELQRTYLERSVLQGRFRKRDADGNHVTGSGMWRDFVPAGAKIPTEGGYYNAFVNMTSMCEMSQEQVEFYLQEATLVVAPGGLLVSVNHKRCVGHGAANWFLPNNMWRLMIDKPFPNEPDKRGDLMVWRRL